MADTMQSGSDGALKSSVRDFWDAKSCGEVYASGESERQYYESQSLQRYRLEPYILDFARFGDATGNDVLEIGVGMGADHAQLARAQPRSLTGVDLTPRAVMHTSRRLELLGLSSAVRVADAENLPFDENSFDQVYSWGVLHHSPDTQQAINEVYRVLRPGGLTRIAIYHKYSLVGYMLWLRYALLVGRPFRSLAYIYAHYLESPGTKAFSMREASQMCRRFSASNIRTQLSFGDLLEGAVGQRHSGMLLSIAKALWPRWLLKRLFRRHGLYLLIEAVK
jgi:ubiquinone/menaquinone biosynthesis C-methylase UbiE